MGRNLRSSGAPVVRGHTADGQGTSGHMDQAADALPGLDQDLDDDGLAEAVVFVDADRPIDPLTGLTKGDVADYYRQVAPWLLPEAAYRPLAVAGEVGAAGGLEHHHHADLGRHVYPVPPHPLDPATAGFYISGVTGLLQLVRADALELHGRAASIRQPGQPDRLAFDLSPGAGADPAPLHAAALAVRERLQAAGLASYLRLDGDGGLQVVAPVAGVPDWGRLQAFASAQIAALTSQWPERYAIAHADADDARIVLRPAHPTPASTAICNWSLRVTGDGLRVVLPLRWEALHEADAAAAPDVAAALRHAARLRSDPWMGIATLQQALPPG